MRSSEEIVPEASRRFSVWGLPPKALGLLGLTAAISLFWSFSTLLTWDEFLVLWTDRLPKVARIVAIQRACPISLDPLAYHLAAHACILLFGANAFAIRIVSLIGFCVMQLCIFLLVREIVAEQTALFAMMLPALTATLFYSIDGRPYGMLLGAFGLAALAWQKAARGTPKRAPWLATLTLAIVVAINLHYFGLLVLVPLCAAELYRTVHLRRFDGPMIVSLAIGASGLVFTLPFTRAVGEFRTHYYNLAPIKPAFLSEAYLALFTVHLHAPRFALIFSLLFAITALIVFIQCYWQWRSGAIRLQGYEVVLFVCLAALPFWGCALALVTHSFEVRHVVCAIIGVTCLLAVAMNPILRHPRFGRGVLAALIVAVVAASVLRIEGARHEASCILAAQIVPPEVKRLLIANPELQLYFQNTRDFALASYYEPDQDVRSRIALVYSIPEERRWMHMDTHSLTALHMRQFTSFRIVSYESVISRPGNEMFVTGSIAGWDWTDQAFADERANVRSVGSAFGADIVLTHFHQ